MGNLSAIILLVASFWLPTLSPHVQASKSLRFACWATIAAHHVAAFINAFITPLSSAWGDLYRFHDLAAAGTTEGQPYAFLLGAVYRTLGTSFWLGETVSVLVFALSLILFIDLQVQLKLDKRLAGSVLIYGLMPSPLIHCSVTMREVYQCFGLLLAIQSLLKLRSTAFNPKWIAALLMALFLMVSMHQSMAAFAVLVLTLGIPWALRGQGSIGAVLALAILFTSPWLLPKLANTFAEDSKTVRAYEDGKLLNYVAHYREGVNASRSDYGLRISSDSIPEFIETTSLVVAMYFIAPLPWQMSSILDIYALVEVWVRMVLFWGCWQAYKSAEKESRNSITLCLTLALTMEVMWGLGTTNWGTAIRHHVPAFGVVAAIGLPYWLRASFDPAWAQLLQRRQRRATKLRAARVIQPH
jgi:hypothetical protein